MNVLAFGQVASITGNEFEILDQINDTLSLHTYLQKKYPELAALKYSLAVNKKLVNENIDLTGSEIVAILPPFSGG